MSFTHHSACFNSWQWPWMHRCWQWYTSKVTIVLCWKGTLCLTHMTSAYSRMGGWRVYQSLQKFITFVLHKALRSMVPIGVHEGFSLISYISKSGTNVRRMNIRKSDVSYPDALSLEQPGSRLERWSTLRFSLLLSAMSGIFGDSSPAVCLASSWWHQQFLWLFQPPFLRQDCLLELSGTNCCFNSLKSDGKEVQVVSSGRFIQKCFRFTTKGIANCTFNLKLFHSRTII